MRIAGNHIRDVKRFFNAELAALYSSDEMKSLFRIMTEHITGVGWAKLITEIDKRFNESELLHYSAFIKRLKSGEPVQYITGVQEFCGLEMNVRAGVLIPRPETEELCLSAIQWIHSRGIRNCRVLDAGTGSGCIAVAIAGRIADAEVHAFDLSEEALSIARENNVKHGAGVNFFCADMLNFPVAKDSVKYHLIVSNPPYIPLSERNQIETHVKDHEPEMALFVPDDHALKYYQALIGLSQKILIQGGLLMAEIHYRAGERLMSLAEKTGRAEIRKDMNGKDRFLFYEPKLQGDHA